MSRYFYDTEFIEDGQTINLISIGMVCEDGREFYKQHIYCDWESANEWVVKNVFPHLNPGLDWDNSNNEWMPLTSAPGEVDSWATRDEIRDALVAFIGEDQKPEFWGYYSAYDHVALCQIFGTMMELPKDWPMHTNDLKQWCDQIGNPKLPEQGKGEHNALADARWNKQVYEFLKNEELSLALLTKAQGVIK